MIAQIECGPFEKKNIKRSALRTAAGVGVASFLLVGLAGCAGVRDGIADGTFFDPTFWSAGPTVKENSEAELGLAALAKGDQIKAETHFQKALKANAQDVDALLGMGILFQSRGMNVRAREMYEAILAIRPDANQRMVVWQDQTARPITEIASLNMALIESGGALIGVQRGAAGAVDQTPYGIAPSMPAADQTASMSPAATMAPGEPEFVQADANIVSRFVSLRALRDQGLLTGEEYAARRQANIGALLPLTSPPPAAGLDRPVPNAEQIAGRLRAIGRALEMRAMTVGQHAAERGMILDALMPAAPVAVANPGMPPQGLMQAADEVRKLEEFKTRQLISDDEYARERRAIEGALQPAGMASAATTGMAAQPQPLSPGEQAGMTAPVMMGAGALVHLASYRSKTDAERGWAQLRRAHQELLGGLGPDISTVQLNNGTFWRLKAGPLASKDAARDLCSKLKARRQYCEPIVN